MVATVVESVAVVAAFVTAVGFSCRAGVVELASTVFVPDIGSSSRSRRKSSCRGYIQTVWLTQLVFAAIGSGLADSASACNRRLFVTWLLGRRGLVRLGAVAFEMILLHDAASLVLFKLTRTPRELWDALEAHKEIRQVLAAMSANGQEHRLQSGAMVYVHPHERSLAESIIARSGVELRFHHIIASEDLVAVISNAVAGIPSRKNVRVRDQTRLCLQPMSIAV